MSGYIEVSEATFEVDVLERSKEHPVVVDFWAAWCGPCRALGPVLEKLAGEADGAWTLAKLDVDANPYISQAFGIQGIPAVKAFKDGKVVAEFTGALPEQHVRAWLAQLGPSEADVTYEHGRIAEARGDTRDALDSYRRALELDPGHAEARKGVARLEVAARASGAERGALEARIAHDPDDVDALLGLADLDALEGDHERAAGRLLPALERLNGEHRDKLRIRLLELLEPLPVDDPVALATRRAIARILF